MANGSGHDSFSSAGGQGQLARLIAMRGGLASPESPFVIEHREALIYMLCEAAELEHGIMCQYLFAAFSLKQGTSEGLTGDEAAAVSRWRQRVSHVATQEMLHLALVQNLLSAIGAAPHLARPNLPQPANHYPAGVQLALLPFGEQALRHFMFLERPEGMDLQDASGLAASGRAQPLLSERDIVPRGQDFATVGHLYRSIEAGLAHLAELHGEDWLFVGPPRAQATTEHFSWPELIPVIDLASAQRAIDEILEQGEGSRGNWQDAHFGQFVEILDEYQQLRSANPAFEPVRPVMAANVRPHEGDAEVPLISDLLTARITDLFNVSYEILLQILERFFAHTQESDAQLKILADTTIGLMFRVLKPLGDLITLLPVGEEHAGMTVGPRRARGDGWRVSSIRSWRPCGRWPGRWPPSCRRVARMPGSRRSRGASKPGSWTTCCAAPASWLTGRREPRIRPWAHPSRVSLPASWTDCSRRPTRSSPPMRPARAVPQRTRR
jgi:hypothetical protein